MNQSIRQSQALLACMRERAQGYHAAARESAGLPVPQSFLYQVLPTGENNFEVIERATGVRQGERFGHSAACMLADQLETTAADSAPQQMGIKHIARAMLFWTSVLGATLAIFVFYGV